MSDDVQAKWLEAARAYVNGRIGQSQILAVGNEQAVALAQAQQENERLRTRLECDERDPAHENCRNAEAQLVRQVEVEAAAQRERDAQVCEQIALGLRGLTTGPYVANKCAIAIRAQGDA